MNAGYLVLGCVLLSVAVLDLLWTTVWIEGGAGPLTSRIMAGTWTVIRRVGSQHQRLLTIAGPTILLSSLATWIVLLWGGWSFVFASADSALIDTLDRGPISLVDNVYFAGYTIFTLGNGDFAPETGIWQLVTTTASASGMLFITLSVTYVLSVLDAVTQKRSFASDVSGLGSTGTEIVRTSWNGDEFEGLEVTLNSITTELNTLTSNHKAYPILHYFYGRQEQRAPTRQIAALDESLTLLRFGVAERHRPPALVLQSVRSSVQNYLETVGDAYISPADRTPPPPDLTRLRDADVPVVSDEEFRTSIESIETRRRTLLALVESDVRSWPSESD